MSTSPVYLVSDVHLGAIPPDRERAFLTWLEHAGTSASELVINGDLFDFWFEYRSAIPRGYTRVLGALARVIDSGVPVRLVGGNHDWWGGSYLEDEVGLTFHRDPVVLDLAGKTTLLAHGDGLGRGDLGYRFLKVVLRSGPTRWAFRWLHPDVGAAVARRVSQTEAYGASPTSDDRARSDALAAWAERTLEERPELDLIALGHSHIPLCREVEPGRWYLNSGDWVFHHSYAVLENGSAPRLLEWSGS